MYPNDEKGKALKQQEEWAREAGSSAMAMAAAQQTADTAHDEQIAANLQAEQYTFPFGRGIIPAELTDNIIGILRRMDLGQEGNRNLGQADRANRDRLFPRNEQYRADFYRQLVLGRYEEQNPDLEAHGEQPRSLAEMNFEILKRILRSDNARIEGQNELLPVFVTMIQDIMTQFPNAINYVDGQNNTILHMAMAGNLRNAVEAITRHENYSAVNFHNRPPSGAEPSTPIELTTNQELIEIVRSANETVQREARPINPEPTPTEQDQQRKKRTESKQRREEAAARRQINWGGLGGAGGAFAQAPTPPQLPADGTQVTTADSPAQEPTSPPNPTPSSPQPGDSPRPSLGEGR